MTSAENLMVEHAMISFWKPREHVREAGGAGLGALLFSASGVETVGYIGHLGPYSEDNCLSRRAKATPLCTCLLKLEDKLLGEQIV